MATENLITKQAQAIAWLKEHPGATLYAAAKAVDLPPQTLYTYARKLRNEADKRCPCCGHLLKGTK